MAAGLPSGAVKHSILDLAPLELDCMNALWPRGEATVRDIQSALSATRPRAYTTIMTILDRLAQKGIVERHKVGRAWVYRPNLSEAEARSRALARVVDGFFDGSAEALRAHLAAGDRPGLFNTDTNVTGTNVAPAKQTSQTPASEPRGDRVATLKTESATPPSADLETTLL